jgi:hypothetical protein
MRPEQIALLKLESNFRAAFMPFHKGSYAQRR